MHYFVLSTKDTYITENSPSHIVQFPNKTDKNYGGDEILQLKKEFQDGFANSPICVSRILTQFDYSAFSSSISDGTISNPKFYLRLYEVEGQKELDKTYSLSTHMLRRTWDEGVGKHFDNPRTTAGCNWESGSSVKWASSETNMTSGSRSGRGGGVWITTAGTETSQSFINQSGDVEMDITNLVNKHLNNTYTNYGFLTKFSGSFEDDNTDINLKFFSRNTNTIYQPKLEVRWNDISYPDSITGSINYITMSGEIENHIFIKGTTSVFVDTSTIEYEPLPFGT